MSAMPVSITRWIESSNQSSKEHQSLVSVLKTKKYLFEITESRYI